MSVVSTYPYVVWYIKERINIELFVDAYNSILYTIDHNRLKNVST